MITPGGPKKDEPSKLGQKAGPTLGQPAGPTLGQPAGPKLGAPAGPALKPGGGPAPTIKPLSPPGGGGGGPAPTIKPLSAPGGGGGVNIPKKIEPAPAAAPGGDVDLSLEDSVEDIPHDVAHEPGEDMHTADEIAAEHAPDHQPTAPPVANFDPPWVNKNAPKEEGKPRGKVDFENLPEFVAQREMLKKVRMGAIIGGIIIVGLIIWFVVGTGKGLTEGVKPSEEKTEEGK